MSITIDNPNEQLIPDGGTLAINGAEKVTSLTTLALVYADSNKVLTSLGLVNGQVAIGSTGAAPVAASLTGTANQVIITAGAGSLTFTTPQDIGTASNVTFGSVTAATVQGSTSASGTLTLKSTSNATKGDMILDAADITMTSTMRARMSGQNRFRHLNNMAKATNSGNTTVSNATITIINWDTNEFDTDNIHSTSSNTSRFTAAIAGKYLLECNLRYATPGASTGSVHVGWRLNGNGASDKNVAAIPISNSATLLMVNAALPVSLAANDYVEFWAFQSNGGNMTVNNSDSFGAISYLGE